MSVTPANEPNKQYVLLTGASRGLGLGLAERFALEPNTVVYAGARTPEKAEKLQELAKKHSNLHIVKLDATSQKDIDNVISQLTSSIPYLSLLFNNAGISTTKPPHPDDTGFGDSVKFIDAEQMRDIFETNVIGPALLSKAALPLLLKYKEKTGQRARIINMSSTMGSIAENTTAGANSYRISKAALNMLSQSWKVEQPDIITHSLCPGWVDTDMGSNGGKMKPPNTVPMAMDNIMNNVVKRTVPAEWEGKLVNSEAKIVAY